MADYSQRLLDELRKKASMLPFINDYRHIHCVLCLREKPLDKTEATVLLPEDIVAAAR